jgi:hypothetical protein
LRRNFSKAWDYLRLAEGLGLSEPVALFARFSISCKMNEDVNEAAELGVRVIESSTSHETALHAVSVFAEAMRNREKLGVLYAAILNKYPE